MKSSCFARFYKDTILHALCDNSGDVLTFKCGAAYCKNCDLKF